MGKLNISFALWIGGWSCVGILVAQTTLKKLIQRTGRQSIIVAILALLLLASTVMIPIFSYPQLEVLAARGINVWAFKNPCA